MGTLKIQTEPGIWTVVGSKGPQGEPGPQVFVGPEPPTDPDLDLWWDSDADGSSSMTQALGDSRYVLKATEYRYRMTRAAASIATGDQIPAGALTVVENVGGFTGNGLSATPLLVPVAGSYAITLQYSGYNFVGTTASAAIIETPSKQSVIAFIQGTTLFLGGTITLYLPALGGIVFKIRNNSGATATNVVEHAEVVRVA